MKTKLVWVSVNDTRVTLQRLTSEQIIIAKNNGFTVRDFKTCEKIWGLKPSFLCWRASVRASTLFIISQPSSFVNRQIVQKSGIKIFQNWAKIFQKLLDFPIAWWYIYIIKRKENKTMTTEERTKKIEELENRIFSLNMIDYWTERQFELNRKLEKELSELKKVAWQNQKPVII